MCGCLSLRKFDVSELDYWGIGVEVKNALDVSVTIDTSTKMDSDKVTRRFISKLDTLVIKKPRT